MSKISPMPASKSYPWSTTHKIYWLIYIFLRFFSSLLYSAHLSEWKWLQYLVLFLRGNTLLLIPSLSKSALSLKHLVLMELKSNGSLHNRLLIGCWLFHGMSTPLNHYFLTFIIFSELHFNLKLMAESIDGSVIYETLITDNKDKMKQYTKKYPIWQLQW